MGEGVTIDPEIMSGKPCIAGTRIPVSLIGEFASAGYDVPHILSEYPDLKAEQVAEALCHVCYQAALYAHPPTGVERAQIGWKDAKSIAAAAVQSACETDPADAEHPDTILIRTDDFETIVRNAVEAHFEALSASPSAESGAGKKLNGFRCHNCKHVTETTQTIAPDKCPKCWCRDFSALPPAKSGAGGGVAQMNWWPVSESYAVLREARRADMRKSETWPRISPNEAKAIQGDFEKGRKLIAALSTVADQGEGEKLKRIADMLIDQRDEPWPGTDADRLHYWRDKAINAANVILATLQPSGEGA